MKKIGGWSRLGIFISALWTISIITFSIYERSTLHDCIYLTDVKPFIFWKWKITSADFSGEKIWDKAAKAKGFKTWNEILLNPEFQKLLGEEKEKARNQYWQDISVSFQKGDIFDQVAEEKQVHEQFDQYTKKGLPLALSLQIFRMTLVSLLPIAAMFSFGYGIGWIRRGFQSHENNTQQIHPADRE